MAMMSAKPRMARGPWSLGEMRSFIGLVTGHHGQIGTFPQEGSIWSLRGDSRCNAKLMIVSSGVVVVRVIN